MNKNYCAIRNSRSAHSRSTLILFLDAIASPDLGYESLQYLNLNP